MNLDFPVTELIKGVAAEMKAIKTPAPSFLEWVYSQGFKPDEHPFELETRPYMKPIYADTSPEIVVQKPAQVGATVWEILWLLYHCATKAIRAGFFFPTQTDVSKLSAGRLNPLLRSSKLMSKVQNLDNVSLKNIGYSYLYMLYMKGIVSTESTPLDVLVFDEVRLMSPASIEKAEKRISASDYKYKLYASTAGYPEADINRLFNRSDQHYFHTTCNCADGVVLSEVFPDCLIEWKGETFYMCPRCKTRLGSPWEGRYVPHNPGSDVRGYHIHRMLSQKTTPAELAKIYRDSLDIKEFYNAELGEPFIAEENRPVNMVQLLACVNEDRRWGVVKGDDGKWATPVNCFMGVDQRARENHVVIKKIVGDKVLLVHLEIVYDLDPFTRLYELMKEYDVSYAVIDHAPSYNEAEKFSRAFYGRIWCAEYHESQHVITWLDKQKRKGKDSAETKFKYVVQLDRFKVIEWSLRKYVDRVNELPPPGDLIQVVKGLGGASPSRICTEYFFDHLTRVARKKVERMKKDPATGRAMETGEFRMIFENVGLDPHFVHANLYCDVAVSRGSGLSGVMVI